jgi:hypothetical protein
VDARLFKNFNFATTSLMFAIFGMILFSATVLMEFESETVYAADKSKRLNVLLSVLTETTLCSWGSRQQGCLEPNRVNMLASPHSR